MIIDFTQYRKTRQIVNLDTRAVAVLIQIVSKHPVKPQDVKTFVPPTLPRPQPK